MRNLAEKYAWANTDYDLAWTVAVIAGSPEDVVLDVYGGGSAVELGEMTFADATKERNDHFGEYGVLQLVRCGDVVVAIEPNGWTGSVPEIAERVSAGEGRFFSVYWSPSGYQILQATNGQVTGRFDPNFIGLPASASDLLPRWVEPEDFPLEQLRSSCLAALERQTGVRVEWRWLEEEMATYRVPDPDAMLRQLEGMREA
jgi:hypothetical protein